MKFVGAILLTILSGAPVVAATLEPPRISVERLLSDEELEEPVLLDAIISDAFPDEVDPRFIYLTLDCDGIPALASVFHHPNSRDRVLALVGRRVELRGVRRNTSSIVSRAYLGRMLNVNSPDDIIQISETTRLLLEKWPEAKVVILTTYETADGIAHAIDAGAKGAIVKKAEFDMRKHLLKV